MTMDMSEKFGVTLILPECAFSAEVQRSALADTMQDIDARLTEQGAPDESYKRCELMIDNMLMLSAMIANREVDQDAAVTDLAYCFIYTFAKSIGFEQIDALRGLTGSYTRNQLRLNPCLNDVDYDQECSVLQRKMNENRTNDDWDFDLAKPPTVH